MKNRFVAATLLVIALCFGAACSSNQNDIEIYSFSGENETFVISDGRIIITNGTEKFIGGNIAFKDEELVGVKEYNTRFYYYKDGDEIILSNNFDRIEGSDSGMNIQSDLGSGTSEKMFYGNDLELIENALNFKLIGTYITGEKFEYKLALDVKKAA